MQTIQADFVVVNTKERWGEAMHEVLVLASNYLGATPRGLAPGW
jgi:hypothetical protein